MNSISNWNVLFVGMFEMNFCTDQVQKLLPDAIVSGDLPKAVSHLTADSRQIKTGGLFAAIPGGQVDGHAFASAAVDGGAAVLLVERKLELHVAQIIVPNAATAFARLVTFQRLGSNLPTLVGITGTNGKTTTTWMVQSILKAAKLNCGRMGTVDWDDCRKQSYSQMTTPAADVLADWLHRVQSHGGTHAVLEVSSHALAQHRCDGLQFAAAAITNVTRDHLDYHLNPAAYQTAKARLVDLLYADAPMLLNRDDPGCRQLENKLRRRGRVLTYGLDAEDAELRAIVLSSGHRRQHVRFALAQGDADVQLRLIGRHNVSNALVAAGISEQLGVRLKDIVAGLESLRCVPGRLERIDAGQPFQVFVDYAHTPDALEKAISAVRSCAPGRTICVFGAGGDRDRPKRSQMGEAATRADFVIVTSDNPRGECPRQIIREIAAGFGENQNYQPIVDREQAIRQALEFAQPGDAVLIAGKGHETTQHIGDVLEQFDDREVAERILKDLNSQSASDLHPVFTLPRSA